MNTGLSLFGDTESDGHDKPKGQSPIESGNGTQRGLSDGADQSGSVGDTIDTRLERLSGDERNGRQSREQTARAGRSGIAHTSGLSRLAVADGGNSGTEREQRSGQHGQQPQDSGIGVARGDTIDTRPQGRVSRRPDSERRDQHGHAGRSGPTDGLTYAETEWIYCRDEKYRPVAVVPESELFQSADEIACDLGYCSIPGASGDEEKTVIWPLIEKRKAGTMRIRGYGNCIQADLATTFIRTVMEVLENENAG